MAGARPLSVVCWELLGSPSLPSPPLTPDFKRVWVAQSLVGSLAGPVLGLPCWQGMAVLPAQHWAGRGGEGCPAGSGTGGCFYIWRRRAGTWQGQESEVLWSQEGAAGGSRGLRRQV